MLDELEERSQVGKIFELPEVHSIKVERINKACATNFHKFTHMIVRFKKLCHIKNSS